MSERILQLYGNYSPSDVKQAGAQVIKPFEGAEIVIADSTVFWFLSLGSIHHGSYFKSPSLLCYRPRQTDPTSALDEDWFPSCLNHNEGSRKLLLVDKGSGQHVYVGALQTGAIFTAYNGSHKANFELSPPLPMQLWIDIGGILNVLHTCYFEQANRPNHEDYYPATLAELQDHLSKFRDKASSCLFLERCGGDAGSLWAHFNDDRS